MTTFDEKHYEKPTKGLGDGEMNEVSAEEDQFRKDVANEAATDPTPFVIRPKKLASLVDP